MVKENESVGRHTPLKRDPMGVLPFLRNEERLLNRTSKGVKLFMKDDCVTVCIITRVGSGFFEIFKTAGIFHFDATRL